ncbi:hypothetical protein VTN00DRAFT_9259 [Thermoascus crustaceus]|uniref:uncharacterized protein n=1 Tax=Thermoascus crustaceus TaxID=5088 RepID=UPI003742E03F
MADTGGPGFYAVATRSALCNLCAGEFSIYDDRWFTKPWGDPENPPTVTLKSKCDHVRVARGDLLGWTTWGSGGLGDPLTRPAEKVALEVHRKTVTFEGARKNYGVVVNPSDFSVDQAATEVLRAEIKAARPKDKENQLFDRGGTLAEPRASCLEETGQPPPIPQWEKDPYSPHVALPYVKEWFKSTRETNGWVGL